MTESTSREWSEAPAAPVPSAVARAFSFAVARSARTNGQRFHTTNLPLLSTLTASAPAALTSPAPRPTLYRVALSDRDYMKTPKPPPKGLPQYDPEPADGWKRRTDVSAGLERELRKARRWGHLRRLFGLR